MGLQQYTLSFKTNLSRAHHFHTAKFINALGILLMERYTVTFITVSYTYKSGHQSIISDQSFTDIATYKLTTEILNDMNNKLLVGGNVLLAKLIFYGINVREYK